VPLSDKLVCCPFKVQAATLTKVSAAVR